MPLDPPLATRKGLPDALRVLLEEYPRKGWQDDPGFDELIRFWLDRHLGFRKLLEEMTRATQGLLDRQVDPNRFAASLSRYGGMFVNGLHEHHTIEDTYYFPKLVDKDARLSRGFEILDADHHALDHHLSDFVSAANAALGSREDRDVLQNKTGQLLSELTRFEELLNRHLTDEEELVVPILLRYGAPDLG